MENTTLLTVKKPLEWYNKNLKIDFKKLFIALTKSAVMFKMADPKSSLKEFLDTFNAFELKTESGGLAYKLLLSSMVNAAHNLAMESSNQFRSELREKEELYDDNDYVEFLNRLNVILEAKELSLNTESFKNPRSISFLSDFADSFKQWLQYFGLDEISAQNVANRLPAYFVMALNDEWRSNPSDYNAILQKTETPFTPAATRELEWQRYYAFLEKQINESVFGESFGLSQIYIPLRGYYKKFSEDWKNEKDGMENIRMGVRQVEKIPFYVHEELDRWLTTHECKHSIKFISGGPGSGKSSFAKMWSAEVASKNKIRVLFIPLHLFDLQSDIMEAVGKYVSINQDIRFSFNPLSPQENSEQLLIIFDGLDELSQQGKYATEVAHNFVTALDSLSKQLNRDNNIKVLFLIIGRELAIQANTNQFRLYEQITHFLPYYLDENEQEGFSINQQKLVAIDQRNHWWIKYGQLKGVQHKALPKELALERLDDITAQPLLNYLVALSLQRGKIAFSKATNLNEIYHDLIEGVHERAYEGHVYKNLEGLDLKDFKRILEEIAVSAWHGGDSRTTSIKRIEEHISRSNLTPLMNKFEKEAEKGILRLLTAFYFREHGTIANEKTFEFTHKSFGEYLIATRLVKQLEKMSDELEKKRKSYDEGWTEEEALKKWMEITSPIAIDEYLYQYIKDEIIVNDKDKVAIWQQNLAKLLSYMLDKGMPMLEPRKMHKAEMEFARNSSESLLVLHAACADLTEKISEIMPLIEESFGAWMSTLQPQRTGHSNVMGYSCVSFLNLSGLVFDMKDFYGANFHKSNLSASSFPYVCFINANLSSADFSRTDMSSAYLNSVDLTGTDLSSADLTDTDLTDANLTDANLINTSLANANLTDANLTNVNLTNTDLTNADLTNADLTNADLTNADLTGIKFNRENIVINLLKVKSLYNCGGLNMKIEQELRKLKPELFEENF